MKTQDLMLNDLVRYDGRICKVVFLSDVDDVVLRLSTGRDGEMCGFSYELYRDQLMCLNAIPITTKLLESTGWEINPYAPSHGFEMWSFMEVTEIAGEEFYNEMCMTKVGNSFCIGILGKNQISVEYVHQIQHVMRLFGLKESANNMQLW